MLTLLLCLLEFIHDIQLFIIQLLLYINCYRNFVYTFLMKLNNFIQTHYDICGQDSYQS